MISDAALEVSTAQPVTVTAPSTSSIDLAEGAPRSLGHGRIHAVFHVDVSASNGGSATVAFELVLATDAALSAGVIRIGSSPDLGEAVLVAGRPPIVVAANIDAAGELGYPRYLGARYVVGSGPLTAGAFTCRFSMNPSDFRVHPKAFAAH